MCGLSCDMSCEACSSTGAGEMPVAIGTIWLPSGGGISCCETAETNRFRSSFGPIV